MSALGNLFSAPKMPAIVPAPPAPAPSSPATNQAGNNAVGMQAGMGQQATILTGGLGDPSAPALAKKLLLGGP